MTNTSTNHYHSSRLIGRVHQLIHAFFSNARWIAEGTQMKAAKRRLEYLPGVVKARIKIGCCDAGKAIL